MQATRSFPFRAFSPLSRSQILSLKTERQPISLRRFHKPRSSSHVLTRCLYPRLLLRQPTSLRASHVLRFNSSNATAGTSSSESLSARLKKLSREYGWSALGIYLLLSALDFPFCFLAVRLLGTERIGHWEHTILEGTKRFVSWPWQRVQPLEATEVSGETHVPGQEEQRLLDEQVVANRWDHGVEEAEKANKGENASLSSCFASRGLRKCGIDYM